MLIVALAAQPSLASKSHQILCQMQVAIQISVEITCKHGSIKYNVEDNDASLKEIQFYGSHPSETKIKCCSIVCVIEIT
jgi:hypothetical protein